MGSEPHDGFFIERRIAVATHFLHAEHLLIEGLRALHITDDQLGGTDGVRRRCRRGGFPALRHGPGIQHAAQTKHREHGQKSLRAHHRPPNIRDRAQ
jgi:hypothetical protein